MFRFLSIGFGISLIVLLGFLLEAQSQTPAPPRVEGRAPTQVFAPGRVEGITEEVELRPQVRGAIVELKVKEGDYVRPGQILLQTDPRQYQYAVTLAQAELARAAAEEERLTNGARTEEKEEARALLRSKAAEFKQASTHWDRIRRLREQAAVSQQEADDQESKVKSLEGQMQAAQARLDLLLAPAREDELKIAQAKVAAAKSQVELAEVELDRTTLRAVSAGQILKLNVKLGEIAGPDAAEPALVIADTSHYRVRAFVEELDAPRVKDGMSVKVVADGLPNQAFAGRITYLSPTMSAKQVWSDDPEEKFDTKAREILIDLADAANLVVGLRVDVVVDLDSAK